MELPRCANGSHDFPTLYRQQLLRHAALRTAESPPEQQTPLWRRFGGLAVRFGARLA
ncbi:MAG: hypothetical protein QOE48_4701 [Mycobacterium sp.]|jgi:hypothetical protein|nr:hypothetical protein [Mycobacterium sp.]